MVRQVSEPLSQISFRYLSFSIPFNLMFIFATLHYNNLLCGKGKCMSCSPISCSTLFSPRQWPSYVEAYFQDGENGITFFPTPAVFRSPISPASFFLPTSRYIIFCLLFLDDQSCMKSP